MPMEFDGPPADALVVTHLSTHLMGTWMQHTLATGAMASAATTAAVAVLGKMDDGSAAGPINAISHILWGIRMRIPTRWMRRIPSPVLA